MVRMLATLFCACILALATGVGCSRPALEQGDDIAGGPGATEPGTDPVPGDGGGDAPGCGDYDWGTAQTLETDDRVATVLASMSLSEKVDQMAGPDLGELFETPDNDALGIRGFRFRDGPRGVRMESPEDTTTCFPVPVSRAATWNVDLERRIGEAMGREVRGLGHNVLLAPCVNTLRHPGWGRGQETYGEDPWLLGTMGTAFTLGAQTEVGACMKHFAGNNIEDTRMTNNAVIEERNLRENYLRQFRMVLRDADPVCVMSAYNLVNGHYCSENNHLLRNILKGEWGYDGFVVSDWFAAQSTVESANGGLDVEMPWRNHYAKLEQAVVSGQVPMEVIDEAVNRILRAKYKLGFAEMSEPYDGDPSVVESQEHIELAREAGRAGMVLLKNDEAVLPLDRGAITRVAVVGPYANVARLGDNGSSAVIPSYAVTPFGGLESLAGAGVEVVTSADASAARANSNTPNPCDHALDHSSRLKAIGPTALTSPCSQMTGTRLPLPITHTRVMRQDSAVTLNV